MLAHTQIADGGVPLYAAATDFGEVFTEEMHSLYLLSFLLTADTDKAEQCFISALDECLEGMGAFMEWARLWARRAVIRQAIRMIKPAPEDTDLSPPVSVNKTAVASPSNNLLAAIVSLSAFERFVFVMSILERLSDGDCLSLLGCSRRELDLSRELAVRYLATTDSGDDYLHEALHAWRMFLGSPQLA
jgi:DNA-directed RNA polymerase specialized sigma24 family protein